METLYDLLGALPRDDAEGLRTAFRQAVKGTHPDLNPGDPDAGKKFREIVRAQEILLDSDQRAAYDHLLELARIEAAEVAQKAAEQARAGQIHKLASWVMGVAAIVAVSIAGLALFALVWTSREQAAEIEIAANEAASPKIEEKSELPATASSPAQVSEPAVAATETSDSPPPVPQALPPLVIVPPPPPIAAQPEVAPSKPELDRLHGFDRAFADSSRPKRADKGGHAINAKRAGAKLMTPRRTAANDLSRPDQASFNPRP